MPRLLMKSLDGHAGGRGRRDGRGPADRIRRGRPGVPWGISESAFNAQYVDGDYQYQSFGVPGLGLKRGLEQRPGDRPLRHGAGHDDRARARRSPTSAGSPPRAGYGTLRLLRGDRLHPRPRAQGEALGRRQAVHGPPPGDEPGGDRQRRCSTSRCPGGSTPSRWCRPSSCCLQERIPRDAPLVEPSEIARPTPTSVEARRVDAADEPADHDGRHARRRGPTCSRTRSYHVMLTNSGAGCSTCRGLDVTRLARGRDPRPVGPVRLPPRPGLGPRVVGRAPAAAPPRRRLRGRVLRRQGRLPPPRRRDRDADGGHRLARGARRGPPRDPDEPRRQAREIELTSYAEVVLLGPRRGPRAPGLRQAVRRDRVACPAAMPCSCRRRPRSADQNPIWAVHVVAGDAPPVGDPQYETDRARFLGRGRSTADPAALDPGAVLSGTTGAGARPDPEPATAGEDRAGRLGGRRVRHRAWPTSREDALTIADQYARHLGRRRAPSRSPGRTPRSSTASATSPRPTPTCSSGSPPTSSSPAPRSGPRPSAIAANRQGQPGPLAARHLGRPADRAGPHRRRGSELGLAKQVLTAHGYLRRKGLEFDLVLWNEEPSSYLHELHEALSVMARESRLARPDRQARRRLRPQGGLRARRGPGAPAGRRAGGPGRRARPAGRAARPPGADRPPALAARRLEGRRRHPDVRPRDAPPTSPFFNGLGGFTPDGREYVIVVRPSKRGGRPSQRQDPALARPAPDPAARPLVERDRQPGLRLPRHRVRLRSPPGPATARPTGSPPGPTTRPPTRSVEAVYLRDEATGEVWCPTPRPMPPSAATVVRHGAGYTIYETEHQGLAHEWTVFVARRRPGEADAAEGPQPGRLPAQALGHLLRRMGAGHHPRGNRHARRHRGRHRDRRPARPEPIPRGGRRPRGVRRRGPPPPHPHGRPRPSSSDETATPRPRPR